MSVRSWRCPNCSANMILRVEEGLFRCPYCDATLTVGDVDGLVERARRAADGNAVRPEADATPQAEQAAPSPAASGAVAGRVFHAAGTAVRWIAGVVSAMWLFLFTLVLLFSGGIFTGPEIAATILFMVPPAVVLYLLWRRRTKK